MIKIDLHTHSIASPDGGLTERDYSSMLSKGILDYVAITDHNSLHFARQLQQELGEKIIVGEEIMTREGEIIGLYLQETIPPQLTPQETVERIKAQGGLVYIPHPFETVRSGISESALMQIIEDVDIIETANGRAIFQNKSSRAKAWAKRFRKATAAASDAHGPSGWGRTYVELNAAPTREMLVALLHDSQPTVQHPGVRGVLYPKLNRARKRFTS